MSSRWERIAEINQLQGRTFGRHFAVSRPAVDIREEAEAYIVNAEVPGMKAEEIDVEVEKGTLTIRGDRKFTLNDEEQKTYRRVERYYGSFERSFSLPENVDGTSVDASLRDGVLEVRIPKKAVAQPHKVSVKAA